MSKEMEVRLSEELRDGERLRIDVKTERNGKGIGSVFEIAHFDGIGSGYMLNVPERDVRHLIKLLEEALVVAERQRENPVFAS